MSRDAKDPFGAFVESFDKDRINSEEGLNRSLLSVAVNLPETHYEAFLRKILSSPSSISRWTFEMLLASTECGHIFSKWLCENFPAIPHIFSSSLVAAVLDRLSSSLPFLYPFERELSLKLGAYRAQVEHAPQVIQALVDYHPPPTPSVSNPQEIQDDIVLVKIKQTQRQRKGAKARMTTSFDPKLKKAFETFGLPFPDSKEDASDHFTKIFAGQMEILEFYLQVLKEPTLEAAIRQTFLEVRVSNNQQHCWIDSIAEKETPPEAEDAPNLPAAYPMVQPMKAALYFDSAEGFGEWRILISTRADRDLREARRKDAKFFKIIIKKIKELSNGHFSDDNQKRLNGPNTEIPIYEAKMTRDSRLIYQIDCIPEYDDSIERQVIKIFGIYTHAQIDRRLWDSIGHQLARKGKEYRQRCLFRNHPTSAGDSVFTPAYFPPAEKAEEKGSVVPELPRESLEEMHSLLVLEKFVTFSQALLNSIIADLDVAHVFNVSPQEKEIIEYPYSCYVLGRSGTGKTTTMLFKMLGIERAYSLRKDTMAKPRQIFVTQSRVLANKVEEYFSKLLDSLSTADKTKEELAEMIKLKKRRDEEEGLVDIDDDHNWRADLPSKFSRLRDEHFPLFLTFDRLASLLEADIGGGVNEKVAMATSSSMENHSLLGKNARLISYNTFLESYWPHFSQSLTKGLDPALVFSEIMGVIQGSEESLGDERHYIDKEIYENMSHRAQYAFASRRGIIYAIFLQYLKQKKLSGEYDAADRTHHVVSAFHASGIPGQKIDFLYVDEAQDNLLIDALLLRSLVRNPDGLFWAGDTAQTISVGSSFRFNDLKAFMFRLEARREGSLFSNGSFAQEAPHMFHLAINYRSHGGIVQCAHSVIELITEFWPHAIDVLSREKGVVEGSKPVFFSGWDSETVRYEQFLFGESGNPIEFGAQQCILVRNEAARQELRTQVGEIGLIMTLYESKGLEFDDVLLYKFFEDSTVDFSQWRVVLSLLEKTNETGVSAPKFDDARHAGVCSELKFLYVAITRARKNLWIVDCSVKGEPMREFWTARNEIQNCTPGTDVPRLAVSSSSEEWEKSGRTLFTNKRYLQAMHCFERAGLPREVRVSHTYYLREQARSVKVAGSRQNILERHQVFMAAAEAFKECAVSAVNTKEKRAYLHNAGDCFEHAQEDFKAAEVYKQAGEFTAAAKLYRKCAKFDEAVEVITQNRQAVDSNVAQNIVEIAKLFYFKNNELSKASQLFDTIDDQLEYLEDFDLDVSRAALLENLGRFREAAEVHLDEGRTLDAIRLFLMDENEDSILRGQDCIVRGLWEHASFGVNLSERKEEVARLLALASNSKHTETAPKSTAADELAMFQAIRSGDLPKLRLLGRMFSASSNGTSAILCYDHFFKSFPIMYRMTPAEISDILHDFYLYVRHLHRIANISKPCQDLDMRKLFCIYPSTGDKFLVPCDTFLHKVLMEGRVILISSNERGIVVSEWELERAVTNMLQKRLVARVQRENRECKNARALNPCASFVVNGYCNRVDCPRCHLQSSSLTRDWYNLQVKIHLQQISIVQAFAVVPLRFAHDRTKDFREWIGRLFDTFYPSNYRLGSPAELQIASAPDAQLAFSFLKRWCMDVLDDKTYALGDSNKRLTMLYQISRLSHFMGNRNPSPMARSSLADPFKKDPNYQRKVGNATLYVIPELVVSLVSGKYEDIARGLLFISHVVEKSIPIDANAFFNLIDLSCGSIILLRRKLDLHNITLPRSWLHILLQSITPNTRIPEILLDWIMVFINSLGQLMVNLHAGQSETAALLVESDNLFVLPGYRNIYLSRLCRAIALVGSNLNNPTLKSEIIRLFRALKPQGRPPHSLYRNYVNPQDWTDITKAFRRSISDSQLDELVQLYDVSKTALYPPARNVRRVMYKTSTDVHRLLDPLNPVIVSNLRADAPAFVPKPREPEASASAAEEEPEQEVEEPEADNTEVMNGSVPVEVAPVAELQGENKPPSEELIQAAIYIQARYRTILRHRRQAAKTALEVSRASCFEAFLAESRKMEWPPCSHYLLLFLGPLPHVLACLDVVHTWVMETKQRNKKRFKTATHQELDDVNKRLTEQKKMIDEIRDLRRALNPESQLHRKRDVEELKRLVRAVEAFISNIAPSVARDVEEDMARGMKGIVAVRTAPKPKHRPALRIDDEADYHDEDYEVTPHIEDECEKRSISDAVAEESTTVPVRRSEKEYRIVEATPVLDNLTGNGGQEVHQGDGSEESMNMRSRSRPWVSVPVADQGEEETSGSEDGSSEDGLAWASI